MLPLVIFLVMLTELSSGFFIFSIVLECLTIIFLIWKHPSISFKPLFSQGIQFSVVVACFMSITILENPNGDYALLLPVLFFLVGAITTIVFSGIISAVRNYQNNESIS